MAKKAKPANREPKSPDITQWQSLAAVELKGKPLASLDRATPEGITVKPLYTEADLEAIAAAATSKARRRRIFHRRARRAEIGRQDRRRHIIDGSLGSVRS